MKRPTRELLKTLGSQKAEHLGWRDMWAMVTRKGDRLYGEMLSKSSDLSSWGSAVQLEVEVPLFPNEGTTKYFTNAFFARVGFDYD